MKKRVIALICVVLLVVVILVVFCTPNKNLGKEFIGYEWENGSDVISFTKDGEFGYYDNSGNPVDDYDLCDKYTYNEKTGKIKLSCSGFFTSLFKNIKVVEYDDKILKLRINGEIKKFSLITNYEDEDFVGFWTRNNNGENDYLSIWYDGSIAYERSKVVSVLEFRENEEYYNSECGEYGISDDEKTYEVKCPIDPKMGRKYIYKKSESKLIVYDVDSEKEIEIKIVSVDKKNLKVEFNDEVMEFKLDR